MLDVALIARVLQKGPGQSVTDAALATVVQLSEAGDHQRAAERAADLLADGLTDVRLVVAFLLGVFEERGPEALPDVFGAVADALSLRWSVLRPEARRERTVDAALSLLFRTLKALVDYHANTRGPAWEAWAGRIEPELPKRCKVAAAALRAAIDARIDQASCLGGLAGVASRAEQYFNVVPPKPAAAAPAPAPLPSLPAPAPAPEPEPPPKVAPPPPEPHPLEVSPALVAFLRKLDAFGALIERGDMARAAIVAQDVRASVDHFDPRVYFPKLLAPHFRLLSAHAAELAPHGEPSPEAEALTQLYHVDLDAFLEP